MERLNKTHGNCFSRSNGNHSKINKTRCQSHKRPLDSEKGTTARTIYFKTKVAPACEPGERHFNGKS